MGKRIIGYRWLEGLDAAASLAQLCATVRLFVKFFQPSFKLAGKERDGARVGKRYYPPATPCQRLLAAPRTLEPVRARLAQTQTRLDPVKLLRDMRVAQQRLVAIADRSRTPAPVVTDPALDAFLSGLRTAWKDGEIRPTAKPKKKQKRDRTVPDPLAHVTSEPQTWLEDEPWRTSRELLERLQAEHPGQYPDHLLLTLQRRLKIWRKEKAHAMVFGPMRVEPAIEPIAH